MPTSAERATYLDSSAIVKLVVEEPESAALRLYLRRRTVVASALAKVEVARALLPFGPAVQRRGADVLSRIDLVRLNDRVLTAAGAILPADLRSLDAIHLATALLLGPQLASVVTYDERLADAARANGCRVVAPS